MTYGPDSLHCDDDHCRCGGCFDESPPAWEAPPTLDEHFLMQDEMAKDPDLGG